VGVTPFYPKPHGPSIFSIPQPHLFRWFYEQLYMTRRTWSWHVAPAYGSPSTWSPQTSMSEATLSAVCVCAWRQATTAGARSQRNTGATRHRCGASGRAIHLACNLLAASMAPASLRATLHED
jgi:hypothetical protein